MKPHIWLIYEQPGGLITPSEKARGISTVSIKYLISAVYDDQMVPSIDTVVIILSCQWARSEVHPGQITNHQQLIYWPACLRTEHKKVLSPSGSPESEFIQTDVKACPMQFVSTPECSMASLLVWSHLKFSSVSLKTTFNLSFSSATKTLSVKSNIFLFHDPSVGI